MPTKTPRERDDDARREKLAQMEEQIKAGTLVIRQMTPTERAKYQRKRDETPVQRGRPRRKGTRQIPSR